MKKIVRKIRAFFIAQLAGVELWLAVQRAEKAYRGELLHHTTKDGRKVYHVGNIRYYVMPDWNDKLIIMHRRNMHKLRKKGRMSEKVQAHDLAKESFYFTTHANGADPITAKLKEHKRKKYVEYRIKSALR
jgi:hypothetical protein